ncbi:folylpolyglutamate synthase, partial [Phenoliferia sp. Uapishka_3]
MSSTISYRTYSDAINLLNGLQSNSAVIESIRQGHGKSDLAKVAESIEYLQRINITPTHLNPLNAIHITGTKGKGSTSAFVDSLLRTIAPDAKVGLYTSPHLVAVRERIRINGKPLGEEVFAKYFFEVWDLWEKNNKMKDSDTPEKPAYFRYLTFMAFHVFLKEKVDATVLEVGVGGTWDSTNLIPEPIVTGVTPVGIDHIFVLGKTIPEIAVQKGGIYKPGVPALAISQPSLALDVLRSRATELSASSFSIIPTFPSLSTIKLGLAGSHQHQNASLALSLVVTFLRSHRCPPAFASADVPSKEVRITDSTIDINKLPEAFKTGLEETSWPGRCQVEMDTKEKGVKWWLDGAHTVESLECCAEWFREGALASSSPTPTKKVLIFNCTSGRSGHTLLGALLSTLSPSTSSSPPSATSKASSPTFSSPFSHVIFCTNTTYSSGLSKGDLVSNSVDPHDLEILATQNELATVYRSLTQTSSPVDVLPSIEDAVEQVRGMSRNGEVVDCLVTGSLILVGGVFAVTELPLDL